jgi:hypothetical protein
MQGERTTDSSVGWLNYNKSGRIYTAKCRCMEEKKKEEEEEGELLIMLLRQTPREERERKKRTP